MSADKYFSIQEQLGREIDPDKIPPEISDFPEVVQNAIIAFNMLGDRIVADIGYLGKDYTLLPVLMEEENKELFLEVLAWLDSKAREKSAEEMKKARSKRKWDVNG